MCKITGKQIKIYYILKKRGPFSTDVMRFARLPNGITSSLEFFNRNQEHTVVRMVITKKMSTLIDCFSNLEISSYRYNFRPRKVWFFLPLLVRNWDWRKSEIA